MRLAPLDNSVVFRKLFRDPEVLTAFVKDLIGIDLHITADDIEMEKRFETPMGAIRITFDIFVQDPTQRIVRFLHYHQAAIMELQKSHRHYTLDRTVYTIVWLTARSQQALFQKGVITTSYHSVATDGEVLPIYPHKLYFINPNYLDATVPSGVADWLQLAAESIRNPEQPKINLRRVILQKASDLIEDTRITPEELAQIMDENDYEGSREADREQGRKQERIAVARALLAKGMDVALISDVTGLTMDELAALADTSD